MQILQVTKSEKLQLEQQLEDLKVIKRPQVVERLQIARGYGDLSENSEYDAAKDELAFVDGQISMLTDQLRTAVIVDNTDVAEDEVSIGKTVKLFDHGIDQEVEYHIVGTGFSNIFENKIAKDAPIAINLIGHVIGDTVTVNAPDGDYKVDILDVEETPQKKRQLIT